MGLFAFFFFTPQAIINGQLSIVSLNFGRTSVEGPYDLWMKIISVWSQSLLFFRQVQYKLVTHVIELFICKSSPGVPWREELCEFASHSKSRYAPARLFQSIYVILWLICCSYEWPSVVQEASVDCAGTWPSRSKNVNSFPVMQRVIGQRSSR